jgi:hypothetical protein
MKLLCEIADTVKVDIDIHLLHELSWCVVCAAPKHNNPRSIGFPWLSCKTALPHTPGPILIRKSVHKDNEVDVIQLLSQLFREGLADPWASSGCSCLIDVIKTPPGKGIVDNISDWSVSETVANEDFQL